MLKRKLTTVFAGTAMLGALCFAPLAQAQSDVGTSVYDPATGTWQRVEPAPSANPSRLTDSPRRDTVTTPAPPQYDRRIPQPSPYSGVPASGHVGDTYFYEQFGGVSPP
jgi:hypothetical protein